MLGSFYMCHHLQATFILQALMFNWDLLQRSFFFFWAVRCTLFKYVYYQLQCDLVMNKRTLIKMSHTAQ